MAIPESLGSDNSDLSNAESSSDEGNDGMSADEGNDGVSTEEDLKKTINTLDQKFDEIQKELAEHDLEKPEPLQQQFLKNYGLYLKGRFPKRGSMRNKVNIEHRNIIYKMARNSSYSVSQWLVTYLAEKSPKLFQEQDKDGHIALEVAISHGKLDFIRAVLHGKISNDLLESMLRSCNKNNENCIHSAILNDLDPELTIALIEKAPASAFMASTQDNNYTPLHFAVEYKRCSPTRLNVVRAMIKCGGEALDVYAKGPGYISVYQHHIMDRIDFEGQGLDRQHHRHLKRHRRHNKENKTKRNEGDVGGTADVRTQSRLSKDVPGSLQTSVGGNSESEGSKGQKRIVDEMEDKPDSTIPRGEIAGDPSKGRSILSSSNEAKTSNSSDLRILEVGLVNPPSSAEQYAPNNASSPKGNPETGTQTRSFRGDVLESTSGETLENSERSSTVPCTSEPLESPSTSPNMTKRSPYSETAENSNVGYERTDRSGSSLILKKKIRNHDSAVWFLFGNNLEAAIGKHIRFGFPPRIPKESEKINFESFKTCYEGIKFDNILLSVNFGRVEIDAPVLATQRSVAFSAPGTGRKDMVSFFDWLYSKEVRAIVKVTVEDRKSPAHSDEAIELALGNRFSIDILDWRKIDLDLSVVQTACKGPDLRELHLWWSGNNAVLRSWSEPGCLKMFSVLEKIYLHELPGLDSADRVRKNCKEFETRLKFAGQRGDIVVEFDHLSSHNQSKPEETSLSKRKDRQQINSSQPKSEIDEYQWLKTMDTFTEGITDLSLNLPPTIRPEYLEDKKLPEGLDKDVRVALIDDGVMFLHKAIVNNIENGRSFNDDEEDLDLGGAPESFHGSATGHGTYMACMIRRICPAVKIFVCKLKVTRAEGKKATFTAKSAADAVEFAVEANFDIISISWTVQKVDSDQDNIHHISRLQTALETAIKSNKLIFCSAPDIGHVDKNIVKLQYPFGCKQLSHGIFRIGTAKADGGLHRWTGSLGDVDFILPGENVELPEADRFSVEDDIPLTGSSVATALAAGLAALIIHCVRLGAIYNHYDSPARDPTKPRESCPPLITIKTYDAMMKAFETISPHCSNGEKRIDVEMFFDGPSKQIHQDSTSTATEKWKQIADIARDLVSSNTLAKVENRFTKE